MTVLSKDLAIWSGGAEIGFSPESCWPAFEHQRIQPSKIANKKFWGENSGAYGLKQAGYCRFSFFCVPVLREKLLAVLPGQYDAGELFGFLMKHHRFTSDAELAVLLDNHYSTIS